MPATTDVPWKTVPSDLGDAPFYVVQFDKDGTCTSPKAMQSAIADSKHATDVFVFSHGWNNDWGAATGRYDRFLTSFLKVRQENWNPPDREFAPVLIGVFWPSAALVAPWEQAPDLASSDIELETLDDLLPDAHRDRFRELVKSDELDLEQVRELAAILAPVLPDGSEETGAVSEPATADDLVAVWRGQLREDGRAIGASVPGGFIDEGSSGAGAPPDTAGFNPVELVRDAIRLATVLQMKDRAGRVGARGVGQMLRRLAEHPGPEGSRAARIHLIGHSYGAKVVLSALCNGPAQDRLIDSVLLLQPALSCYAFTDDLEGHPGGYRSALERVRQPIMTTYSRHDVPLTKTFHLAVRRSSDLAELKIAALPPSKFAAMGGFGPHGVDATRVTMGDVGVAYTYGEDPRVVAVEASRYISSHGGVETPQTAWALLSQLRR